MNFLSTWSHIHTAKVVENCYEFSMTKKKKKRTHAQEIGSNGACRWRKQARARSQRLSCCDKSEKFTFHKNVPQMIQSKNLHKVDSLMESVSGQCGERSQRDIVLGGLTEKVRDCEEKNH